MTRQAKGLQTQRWNNVKSVCRKCGKRIWKGMKVVRVTRGHHNLTASYHYDCYTDAHGRPIY